MKLLTRGNTKTVIGERKGYITFIMHLAPAKLSGYEVCGGTATRPNALRHEVATVVCQRRRVTANLSPNPHALQKANRTAPGFIHTLIDRR